MLPGLPPLVHLETVTASGATSVTVPASGNIADHANFPAGSKHVVVMYSARSGSAGTEDYALVRVNGDTGSNYDMQRLDGFTTTVAAYKETGIVGWSQIAAIAGDGEAAGIHTPGAIMIPNAFATTGYAAMINVVGVDTTRSRFGAGTWRNTAAITSMNFSTSNGLTGSFSLYVVDEEYLVSGGEEVLTGTSAFTNRSVPSQVGDISIINYLRSSSTDSNNDGIDIVLNDDETSGNYTGQLLMGIVSSSAASNTAAHQTGGCNCANSDSNYFSGALTSVSAFNYGDNDPHVLTLSGEVSVSAASGFVGIGSNKRDNVEAVTSVNIKPKTVSTFLAGSGQWVYAVPKTLISRTTLTGTATNASFDLSSLTIPAGTTHLRLNSYARSDRSANSAGINVQFNGDTTNTNYNRQNLIGRGTTVAAAVETESNGRTAQIPAASSGANEFGSSPVLIPWYAGSYRKQSLAFTGAETHSDLGVRLISGDWENTAAITSIEVKCSSDNFVAGSIFELEAIIHPSGWSGTVMGVANPAKVMGVEKENIGKVMGVESA